MISYDQAKKIVEDQLNAGAPPCGELVVLDDETQVHDFGWVFFYTTARFLDSRSVQDTLAGNAPVICLKETGECFTTGTAEPIENYVARFLVAGDPHAVLEPRIRIVSFRYGANKVQATKYIKSAAEIGLKDAKQHVDAVLSGQSTIVELPSPNAVERAAAMLSESGFVVEKMYRTNRNSTA